MSRPDQGSLQAIFDALDTGIVLLDGEHRVIAWNDWFSATSGLSCEGAAGRRFEECFPGHEMRRLSASITEAFESGISRLLTHSLHPGLLPLMTRAGRPLIHDVTVRTVGHDPSKVCLLQIADVSIAVERERVLRERQNARYDAVVESAPDVILTVDAGGIIQLANPAALAQFGYDAEELVGKSADILFPDQAAWEDTRRAVMRGRDVHRALEVTGLRKDGSLTHLELSLSRWQSQSRVYVTAILRDVNERHLIEEARRKAAQALADLNATLEERVTERTAQLMHAEEALRQSAKMEAVGQLTGGIAHDFNNLLQGIMGALDRVKKRIAEGRIADVDRFLDGALASANRAAALTHRLLAFSRRQPVDPRPLDVNDLVASVEELLRRSVGESVQLRFAPTDDLWLVRCDSNQLENALLNLAINARDAMPEGGTLTVETGNAVLDARQGLPRELPPGEYVRICVKDTGVGMPSDVRARAFDPFYTTKPIGQGTGLGLSMIYGFVRQSDGSIVIDSEVGRGTAIEILLPRFTGAIEERNVEETSHEAHRAGNDEVVLVVEDEAVVRLLIVELLSEMGYHALEAADGPTALRILQSAQRIDLLITDIGLPGLNGRQLADAGRERRPGLRVLFMTGYAETAAGKDFLDDGMEIVAKPFAMETLATKIREMIEAKIPA